jgi:hypothetical protein
MYLRTNYFVNIWNYWSNHFTKRILKPKDMIIVVIIVLHKISFIISHCSLDLNDWLYITVIQLNKLLIDKSKIKCIFRSNSFCSIQYLIFVVISNLKIVKATKKWSNYLFKIRYCCIIINKYFENIHTIITEICLQMT